MRNMAGGEGGGAVDSQSRVARAALVVASSNSTTSWCVGEMTQPAPVAQWESRANPGGVSPGRASGSQHGGRRGGSRGALGVVHHPRGASVCGAPYPNGAPPEGCIGVMHWGMSSRCIIRGPMLIVVNHPGLGIQASASPSL